MTELGDTWYADANEKTKAFIDDILAVYEKHQMALCPIQCGEPSHHDSVVIVPLTDSERKYTAKAGFDPVMLGLPIPE